MIWQYTCAGQQLSISVEPVVSALKLDITIPLDSYYPCHYRIDNIQVLS